jgi:hypothetical protein
MCSGKDTLSNYFINEASKQGLTYRILKFADPLYEICSYWGCSVPTREDAANNLIRKLLDAKMHVSLKTSFDFKHSFVLACEKLAPKNANDKPRELLQFVGTELVRSMIDKDAWVKLFLRTTRKLNDACIGVVCNDMRFQNEYTACGEDNFVLIRLEISNKVRNERYKRLYCKAPSKYSCLHPSERDLDTIPVDGWDAVFITSESYWVSEHYKKEMDYLMNLAFKGKGEL